MRPSTRATSPTSSRRGPASRTAISGGSPSSTSNPAHARRAPARTRHRLQHQRVAASRRHVGRAAGVDRRRAQKEGLRRPCLGQVVRGGGELKHAATARPGANAWAWVPDLQMMWHGAVSWCSCAAAKCVAVRVWLGCTFGARARDATHTHTHTHTQCTPTALGASVRALGFAPACFCFSFTFGCAGGPPVHAPVSCSWSCFFLCLWSLYLGV